MAHQQLGDDPSAGAEDLRRRPDERHPVAVGQVQDGVAVLPPPTRGARLGPPAAPPGQRDPQQLAALGPAG
ncbi:hypothetical protein, partial [Georgenia thermotolerans]|uniref:hypothetical protein n=1 Tax=Georgenia thermotolerans TaxID=527326 RepID=UPI001B8B0FAC